MNEENPIALIAAILLLFSHFILIFRRLKCIVPPYYPLVMFGASLVGCWPNLLGSQSVT